MQFPIGLQSNRCITKDWIHILNLVFGVFVTWSTWCIWCTCDLVHFLLQSNRCITRDWIHILNLVFGGIGGMGLDGNLGGVKLGIRIRPKSDYQEIGYIELHAAV